MKSGLNLGSGQRRFHSTAAVEWTNIDHVSRPPDQVPDLVCDARKLPFPDESIDFMVAWHSIEHFGCGEADGVIHEAYRVLRKGGLFIAAVPDLKQLAIRWLSGQISDYIYMVNMYGAFQNDEGDRHKWGYSQTSFLQYVGGLENWKAVEKWDGVPLPGTDLNLDWWFATCEATK